mmetsp:Transcript_13588/g.26619  ORF Transcript_13588/g.26619 Transcript_13588/m.26619 type:complete len:378 (+) Transcript_13588:72-1205(+)
MFTVEELFKDVYQRPPGHEGASKPKRMEKRVLASVIRQTDFHNKKLQEEEMWAARQKDLQLSDRLKREKEKKKSSSSSSSRKRRVMRMRSDDGESSGDREERMRQRREKFERRADRDSTGDNRHSSKKPKKVIKLKKRTISLKKKRKRKEDGDQKDDRPPKIDWAAERRRNERLRELAWLERQQEEGDERIAKVNLDELERDDEAPRSEEVDEGSPSDVATNASQPKGRKHVKKSPKRKKKKKSKKKDKKSRKDKKKKKGKEREKDRDRDDDEDLYEHADNNYDDSAHSDAEPRGKQQGDGVGGISSSVRGRENGEESRDSAAAEHKSVLDVSQTTKKDLDDEPMGDKEDEKRAKHHTASSEGDILASILDDEDSDY